MKSAGFRGIANSARPESTGSQQIVLRNCAVRPEGQSGDRESVHYGFLAESRLDLNAAAAVLLAINDKHGYAVPSLPPTQERTARATEQDGTYQGLGTVRKRSQCTYGKEAPPDQGGAMRDSRHLPGSFRVCNTRPCRVDITSM